MKLILAEKWSKKYKRSINCAHPKGFSQRAHCQGRKKNESLDRLFLKETSVVIDEATLKFSEKNVDSFVQHVVAIGQGKSKEFMWEENVPFSEMLYLNNPFIKAGLPIFYHGNVTFEPLKIKEYEENWDNATKQWKPEYLSQFIDKTYPVTCYIDIQDGARGRSSTGAKVNEPEKKKMLISINPQLIDPYDFAADLALVVRHELQHTAQTLNEIILKYGQQISKANGDFSKISVMKVDAIRSSGVAQRFGIGQKRYRTGLAQPQVPINRQSSQAEKDSYFAADIEFETWIQDFVEEYYKFLVSYGVINLPVLARKSPDMLNKTANEVIGNLFQEDSVLRDTFFNGTKWGETFAESFNSLFRLRKREFITDLRANFEDYLNKKVKNFLASSPPMAGQQQNF